MYLRDGETAVDVGRLVDVDKATILWYHTYGSFVGFVHYLQ